MTNKEPLRTAFITGATSGIGWATALEMTRLGFRVVVCGRRTERLSELLAELPAGAAYALTFDVRDRAATEAAIASLPVEWRRIDPECSEESLKLVPSLLVYW